MSNLKIPSTKKCLQKGVSIVFAIIVFSFALGVIRKIAVNQRINKEISLMEKELSELKEKNLALKVLLKDLSDDQNFSDTFLSTNSETSLTEEISLLKTIKKEPSNLQKWRELFFY